MELLIICNGLGISCYSIINYFHNPAITVNMCILVENSDQIPNFNSGFLHLVAATWLNSFLGPPLSGRTQCMLTITQQSDMTRDLGGCSIRWWLPHWGSSECDMTWDLGGCSIRWWLPHCGSSECDMTRDLGGCSIRRWLPEWRKPKLGFGMGWIFRE